MAAKLVDRITKLWRQPVKVAVGLPRNSLPYPDGTSVVMVGVWNEFGTKFATERPWLRTAAAKHNKAWLKLAEDIYRRSIAKDKDPQQFMPLLGQQMEADVKASIDSGAWEPNQGAYGAWKLKTGKTKPLILTGHMRGSVRYVLRES